MLTKYLILAMILLSIIGTVAGKLYWSEKEAHIVTQYDLRVAKDQYELLKLNIEAIEKAYDNLEKNNTATSLEAEKAERTLDALRDREATVLAKKGLVQRKINRAFNTRENSLACMTGDFSSC